MKQSTGLYCPLATWALAICALAITGTASGCTILVDGAFTDQDAGMSTDAQTMDAPPVADCAGATDGTACGGARICIGGECELSDCGDGVTDPATEECDDDNDVSLDGCEEDCRFTCEDAGECDDMLPCNGEETCTEAHLCAAGVPFEMGAACERPEGAGAGECRGNDCVAAGCGNSIPLDPEECDDGNMVSGDGCEPDCTFSCELDADCDDASVCTGTETCDMTAHTCVEGTTLACDDSVACTSNECDATMGCVYPLIDADMDGHASMDLGACGDDCNDMRGDVSPSSVELCGDALDSDCDGAANPASTPTWYLDCDGDTYASIGAASQVVCSEPPATAGCSGGGWTTRVPVTGNRSTFDCNDSNASVRPSQTSYFTGSIAGAASSINYDYNCDIVETPQYPTLNPRGRCDVDSRGVCGGQIGWDDAVPLCGGSGTQSYCRFAAFCFDPPCTCGRGTRTATQACR